MGQIIVPRNKGELPAGLDRHVRKSYLDEIPSESTYDWIQYELNAGRQTNTGARILATIQQGHDDIYVIPTARTGSYFDDDCQSVVFDFYVSGTFIPSANPERMHPAVLLFHELGHAAQWISRRNWFLASKQQSIASREFRKLGYFKEIEMDNLRRHEWPMSRELNVPTRMHYEDIFDSDLEARERWDKTNTAAIQIQRALRTWLANR